MSSLFRRRDRCALCTATGDTLREVLSLAATPPANEFVEERELGQEQARIPLTLLLCGACGHLQLAEIVDPERLFRNYVYVSGTSPVFVAHFREYATDAIARFGLGASSLVVDVGSNDGTLLKQFQAQGVAKVLGIDPATEIAAAATAQGVPTLSVFFSSTVADEVRAVHGAADLIAANNVFAHTEQLEDFARGVGKLLTPDGVFVFEVSYLLDVLDHLLFDTIYHEHLSYHALVPLTRFFQGLGLRLFDAQRVDTHGGSIRCFVSRQGSRHADSERLSGLLAREHEAGLFSPASYAAFKGRIRARADQVVARVKAIRESGKSVCGFGAPAKLTTLMYEFGLTDGGISFIVDDSPLKQGRFTPGSHIPVRPSAALYEQRPDFCVVFAWNFAESIVAKHQEYLANGGHFLVPLPELREY